MSLILQIDTATEQAHISLARDGKLLLSAINPTQKDHASFLQVAIRKLTADAGISLNQLDAVAVTAGPGSYTGLRVGMASAKGLCYALNKPMISLDTLSVWAASAIDNKAIDTGSLLCPMIDARRMEVFTAVYNNLLDIVLAPCALIIDANSFAELLQEHTILFFGNGAAKWQQLCLSNNARFIPIPLLPEAMCKLANKAYDNQQFTQLADSEPLYLKEFYMPGNL